MAAQDYDGAHAWFAAVLEFNPKDEEAQQLCEKSQMLLAHQKLNAFTRILYSILGNLLFGLNMHSAAVGYLGVLSLDKAQNPMLAAKYGKSLMETGQPALASLAYRRAIKFLPNNKMILKGAGPVFEAVDDKPAAIEVYHTLHRLEPKENEWPLKVKNLSAEHYGKTGGITDLKAARADEDRQAAAMQTNEGREDRIKEILDKYKENPEERADLLPEVGRLLVQIGKYDHAMAIWNRVLEAEESEDAEEAEHMIGLCHEKKGDFDKAEEIYLKLRKAHPMDPRYCDSLYGLRLASLQKQIEEEPENFVLVHQHADLETEFLDIKIAMFKEIVDKRGGDPDTLLAYGKLLHQRGNIDQAIPVIQKAAQNPARAFPGLKFLGRLFFEKGQMPLAIDTYKRALEKTPSGRRITTDLKEIWYGLGESYLKQGDRENARNWFKNIYEADIEFRDIREKYESLLTGE
jgi:tetratricopeptide (TPR) repeat protein